MITEVYYKKVGDEFVPVKVYDSNQIDALPEGHHLISVMGNFTTRKRNVDPDFAMYAAAAAVIKENITSRLIGIYEATPASRPITPEQHELWKQLKESFVDADFAVVRKSVQEVATDITDDIADYALAMSKNPATKVAWEEFKTVAELSKKHEL